MTFAQFMEWALYHPSLGYYMRPQAKIGKEGDYYTSAHVHSVFGETLASVLCQLADTFAGCQWNVVEFGGGDGKLARDILNRLNDQRMGDSLSAYYVIEMSPYHRALAETKSAEYANLIFADGLEKRVTDKPLIVLSNELIDAMPVHRLRYVDGKWNEIYVLWNEQRGEFEERLGNLSSPEVIQYVQEECPPEKNGQTIEVNLAACRWLQQVAAAMPRGYVLTIDYGYLKEELWRRERMQGTLMCYDRHRAHANPYIQVGKQDMTTHVNFTSLQRWGKQFGLRTLSYTTQSEFLRRAGILEKLQEHQDPDPFGVTAKRNRAIRQLIAPGGMGDTFKILLQGKNMDEPF